MKNKNNENTYVINMICENKILWCEVYLRFSPDKKVIDHI